jgi:BlaI family transcriptional regulator, penicillinase repressor
VVTIKRRGFTRPELLIMESLWALKRASVREIHESLPLRRRPAYTTVQTTIYRLEAKGALRCLGRVGKANVFEPAVTRDSTQRRLIDELLRVFGGEGRPIVARLVEAGALTLADIKDAEEVLRRTRKDSKA